MLMTDSVMCAEQPGLEVGEGDMDHRQVCIGSLGVAIKHDRLVRVSQGSQLIVALPAIGAYNSALCYILLHESRERLGAAVLPKAQSQSPFVDGPLGLFAISARRPWAHLDGSSDRRLMVDSTALAPCAAAHQCLIPSTRIGGPRSAPARPHPPAAPLWHTLEPGWFGPRPS